MHTFISKQINEKRAMKIFKFNFRSYVISDSFIAQTHASEYDSNLIQSEDVFKRILTEDSYAQNMDNLG